MDSTPFIFSQFLLQANEYKFLDIHFAFVRGDESVRLIITNERLIFEDPTRAKALRECKLSELYHCVRLQENSILLKFQTMGEFILHTNTTSMLDIVAIETLCSYVVGSKEVKFIYDKLYERVVTLFEPLGVALFEARALLIRPFSREFTHIALINSVLYYKTTSSSMSLKPNSIELSTVRKCTPKIFYENDCALELHFEDFGQSILFVLESTTLRNSLLEQISKLCTRRESLSDSLEMWKKRQLSNYQFLLEVNDYVGRTKNDFAHYPIFPWIFSDYESQEVSYDGTMFRNPFTKISNSKIISTSNTLKLLKKKFDKTGLTKVEDLLDIKQQWLQSKNNETFISEVVPDFYEKEESNSTLFKNVALPPWANTVAEYLRVSIEALESPVIFNSLGSWINSIFGPFNVANSTKIATECNLLHLLSAKLLWNNSTLSTALPFEVPERKLDDLQPQNDAKHADEEVTSLSDSNSSDIDSSVAIVEETLEDEIEESNEEPAKDSQLHNQYTIVVQENRTLGEKVSQQASIIKSLQTEREKLKQDCAHLRDIAASIDLELSQTKFLLASLKEASDPEGESVKNMHALSQEVELLNLEKEELLHQVAELKAQNSNIGADNINLSKTVETLELKIKSLTKQLGDSDSKLDNALLKIADLNKDKEILEQEVHEKGSMLLQIEDMATESAKVLETLQYKIIDNTQVIANLETSKKTLEESLAIEREQHAAIKTSMMSTIQELKDRIVSKDLEYDKFKNLFESLQQECSSLKEKHQKLAIQLQQSLETAALSQNAKTVLEQSNKLLEEEYIAQRGELTEAMKKIQELSNALDQSHESILLFRNEMVIEREAKDELLAQINQMKSIEKSLSQQLEYLKRESAKENKKALKERSTPRFIKQIINNSVAEVKEKKYISLLEDADKEIADWKKKYFTAIDDHAKLKSEVKNLNALILKNSHDSEKKINELEKLTKSYDVEKKKNVDKIAELEKLIEDLSAKPKLGTFFVIPKIKTALNSIQGTPRANPNSSRREYSNDFGSIERINTEALKSSAHIIANDFSNIISSSNFSPQPNTTPTRTVESKVLKDDEFTVTAESM